LSELFAIFINDFLMKAAEKPSRTCQTQGRYLVWKIVKNRQITVMDVSLQMGYIRFGKSRKNKQITEKNASLRRKDIWLGNRGKINKLPKRTLAYVGKIFGWENRGKIDELPKRTLAYKGKDIWFGKSRKNRHITEKDVS